MTDWHQLTARAALASHRLIGWIYWDPGAIERFTALGVEGGFGYYIASRAAPLASAGHEVVAAAFYSIHPGFIEVALNLTGSATTFEEVAAVRDAAVAEGLRSFVPEVCDGLADLGPHLWEVADSLSASGRVVFAAHRRWPRSEDPTVSAWQAVNCLREWRGDTHFAILTAEGIDGVAAGVLHNALLNYPDGWIPRSRGADDAAIDAAMSDLAARGFVADGRVTPAGEAFRESVEDRTDERCEVMWRRLGEDRTHAFLDLIEPVGQRLLERIDVTAGPNWMPAARTRQP